MYFSIIIPVSSGPDEIKELLDSLVQTDYKEDFELVIIEDGSNLTCENVIDSFKRKMEAIDGVFKDSIELASIGSKAQYMQYLSTIFKTSKVKDIVYHGTVREFNKFDKKAKKYTHIGIVFHSPSEDTILHSSYPTGCAIEDLDTPPDEYSVQGRDLLTGKPKQVDVSYREIAKALDKSIQRIEDAIMETLSQTPPELAADIYNTGIYLAGGGSMLRGLDKRISLKTDLPVYIAEDPLRAVVRGTGMTLKNLAKYKNILIK